MLLSGTDNLNTLTRHCLKLRGGFRHRQHRLLPRASHKHMLVDTTGITVGKGRILMLPWLKPILHDTWSCTRSRILAGIMVRKYRVIRALHYTNLYKRGLASPRLPRASHNLKPPLLKLFETDIIPAFTYGFHLIWTRLSVMSLQKVGNLKSKYILWKFTHSQLVCVLTREPYLLDNLTLEMLFPCTTMYEHVIDKGNRNKRKMWQEFCSRIAMMNREWIGSN
jgi:hypothetical protein